jgi:hypothetical protein
VRNQVRTIRKLGISSFEAEDDARRLQKANSLNGVFNGGFMMPIDQEDNAELQLFAQMDEPGHPAAQALDGTTGVTGDSSTGTALQIYREVRRELAVVQRVEEVKDIRDKALAMEKYAREAKSTDLVDQAVETRLSAERRAGEILAEMLRRGERDNGRGNRNAGLKSQAATPKLADMGITRSQSSRWQHLALLSEKEFESKVEHARWKALRAIDGKGKLVKAKRRDTGHADRSVASPTNPNKVLTAIKILCAAPSVENVAAAAARSLKGGGAADVAVAIAFLQKVQHALCATERESS